MTKSLDLNIIPVCRRGGQDVADLPGLYVAQRYRRPVRSRSEDRLILLLSLAGNASLLEVPASRILDELTRSYYKTSGSVTSALRGVAAHLNDYLLEINLKNPGAGQPLAALLSQLVIRGEQLYIAQSGPVHAYTITRAQVVHHYAPDLSGRGLGLAKNVPIRFVHHQLEVNHTVLVSDQHYAAWEKDVLSGLYGENPGRMHRRILSRNVRDMRAVLLQSVAGTGTVHLLKLQVKPDSDSPQTSPSSTSPAAAPDRIPAGQETGSQPDAAAGRVSQPESTIVTGAVAAAGSVKSAMGPASAGSTAEPVRETAPPATQAPAEGAARAPQPSPAAQAQVAVSENKGSILGAIGNGFRQLLRPLVFIIRAPAELMARVLPEETIETIPNRTMAVVALIVPVLVVTISVLVYIWRGVESQSQVVLDEAMSLAIRAREQTDIMERRSAWVDLVDYLDAADLIYTFPESQQLRTLAQQSLDEIDAIKRIGYESAIYGGLPGAVEVVRIVSVDEDLYMLDGNSGSVYYAQLSDKGYVLDGTFLCGPGALEVEDRLIDILPWPVGYEPQASIVALDAQGRLVYCQPGQEPVAEELTRPAESDLASLTGFTMDAGNLFVLDPAANSIWIYWGSDVSSSPSPFFADQVPPLGDVTDLMMANNELYLLHEDGHLTICEYSAFEVSPTGCKEPAPYVDSRQGRENRVLEPESPFTQIIYNPPPDPSLYVLQSADQAIYLFSLRTPTYQMQYQALSQIHDGEATAFTVDPVDRLLYLAVGNHVYYGRIP